MKFRHEKPSAVLPKKSGNVQGVFRRSVFEMSIKPKSKKDNRQFTYLFFVEILSPRFVQPQHLYLRNFTLALFHMKLLFFTLGNVEQLIKYSYCRNVIITSAVDAVVDPDCLQGVSKVRNKKMSLVSLCDFRFRFCCSFDIKSSNGIGVNRKH